MRITKIIPVVLLLAASPTLAEAPIDTAVTIRNTVLRAEPVQTSDVVTELAADTEVEIFERQRIWVRLATTGSAQTEQGWLRFTELRIGVGAGGAVQTESPGSGGFAGFSRSVSGFLSGFRGRGSRTTQKTSTIGIRGLTVADLEAARPDVNALAAVSRFAISKAAAQQFANAGGLAARNVPYGGEK